MIFSSLRIETLFRTKCALRNICGFMLSVIILAGCAPREPADGRAWRDYVGDLTNTARLGQMELTGTRLISSFDPTGGNDDFNHFQAPGSEPGWVTLADLKGPGVVRRFWTTGVDPGHPFKLYFDGEKTPRISGAIDELFGERFPFQPPLAHCFNLCWYSYIPLTYRSSLRIETKAPPNHPFWGPRRLFFQLNVETCPEGQPLKSFPRSFDDADRVAIAAAQSNWLRSVDWPVADWSGIPGIPIAPTAEVEIFRSDRPGELREWWLSVEPATPAEWTQTQKEQLLQETLVRVRYDGLEKPSIEAPLGDFFGNAWRGRNYGSLLLGSGAAGYHCAFPMPFAQSCRISLLNAGSRPLVAHFRGDLQALSKAKPAYFHAEWRRSGPANGTPHTLLDVKGAGYFVGCFLGLIGHGVTQQDNSWWLLEGDEQMFVDGEPRPSWHGTGLEDYFNGGWYYRNAAFNALHGIYDRSPFRVAQFRHQLVDPATFRQSFKMQWERGDQNVSYAWFQTTAYFYLDKPQPVLSIPVERAEPADRYARQTMMLQLTELERMNNFQKAIDLIAEYKERYPDGEENGVYTLRALEYHKLLGENVTDSEYAPFLDGNFGAVAAEQAKLLVWFHAGANRALVSLNANAQAKLYLDGQQVLAGDHPLQLFVKGVELGDGPHVLAAEALMARQEPWVQMAIRTHTGLVGSGLDTLRSRTVSQGWNTLNGNTAEWMSMIPADLLRGTPDAPIIGSAPNAFVLMGSKAYSVRGEDWGYHRGMAYFRQPFTAPLNGWPASARATTGLSQ